MTDRPNILLILTDQWRRQALGCNGHPVVRMPHIGQLAREGATFGRCYAANPVCTALPREPGDRTLSAPNRNDRVQNDLMTQLEGWEAQTGDPCPEAVTPAGEHGFLPRQ